MTSVTVAQLAIDIDDPAANRAAIERAVRTAPPGVVVLPELANTGYCFATRAESERAAEPLDGPTVTLLHALAAERDSLVVCGIAEKAEGGPFNTAVAVDGSGLLGTYRKVHLWHREPDHFTPGDAEPTVLDTRFGRIGLVVCYDLEFPEWPRMAALAGAELLCAPVNWPATTRPSGERPIEQVAAQAAASASRFAVAVADRAGPERGVDWVGGSIIVAQDGYPRTPPALGTPALLTAPIDIAASRDKHWAERNDAFADRRPELYRHTR